MKKLLILLLLFIFSLSIAAAAKKDAPPPPKTPEEAFEANLKYQQGVIVLKDGLATLNLPQTFRYLDPTQTEKVLVEGWGNPPGQQTLGMLVPANVRVLDENSWGVIISYEEEGYVKDDEADSINYGELLTQMKESITEENQERVKQGYEKVDLLGWAEPPHYDKASHKLYWAKEIRFGENPNHTLNYNIRALGRRGVLVLNAVATMDQLKTVQTGMQDVLKFVEFNQGNRYADFTPGADKVATYGIGALIAGKLAAKAGLFKLLIGLLVAGKKFIIIGAVAIGALVKKFFFGGKAETTESE